MKKIFIIFLLFLLVGCSKAPKLGATEDEIVAQLQTDLVNEQVEWKKTHEKYKTKEKAEKLPFGMTYWVDEYVAPNGIGYQVYIKKKNGQTRSFGVGVESNQRSFNWTPLPVASSTPQ